MAEESQRMTISIPKTVHDRLSKLAEADRRSLTGEIVEAIEERFERFEREGKLGK